MAAELFNDDDDAGEMDALPPAMMLAVAALDRDDLSEEEQDHLLKAALKEGLKPEGREEACPAGDHQRRRESPKGLSNR